MNTKLSQINAGVPVQYAPSTDTAVGVRTIGGVASDQLLSGLVSAANMTAIGTAPTVAVGAGAGSGSTATVGQDNAGVLTITTAGTPAASSTVVTVTANVGFTNGCAVLLFPANAAALSAPALSATGSTTGWTVTSGTSALTTGQTLEYNYVVIGY